MQVVGFGLPVPTEAGEIEDLQVKSYTVSGPV